MGGTLSNSIGYWIPRREHRILLMGLSRAGKTTILYKLKHGKMLTNTFPSAWGNVEEFVYKGVTMSMWDTGGQVIHKLADYSKDIKAIIFVVDAHDSSQIPFAQEILHSIVSSDGLQDAPVLILANKHDLSGALNESELITPLRLFDLKSDLWHIQMTSAVTGEGLYEAMDWLTGTLNKKA